MYEDVAGEERNDKHAEPKEDECKVLGRLQGTQKTHTSPSAPLIPSFAVRKLHQPASKLHQPMSRTYAELQAALGLGRTRLELVR